jgi:hypothetical protein
MADTIEEAGRKIRAIIDDAIARLLQLPMESWDEAASMLACQAILRIEDNEKRRQVEQFAIDSVWDVDNTDDATLRAPAAENLH